jgi:hypothetical protein
LGPGQSLGGGPEGKPPEAYEMLFVKDIFKLKISDNEQIRKLLNFPKWGRGGLDLPLINLSETAFHSGCNIESQVHSGWNIESQIQIRKVSSIKNITYQF